MAYEPNPLDTSRPSLSDLVRYLPQELRAIKTRLVTDKEQGETVDEALVGIAEDILALQEAIASGTRHVLLTSTARSTFVVPPGIAALTVIAVGGGMGGWGGFGEYLSNGRSSWTGYFSYCGENGFSRVATIEVEEEQELDYICGAGGSGGNAASGDFQLATYRTAKGSHRFPDLCASTWDSQNFPTIGFNVISFEGDKTYGTMYRQRLTDASSGKAGGNGGETKFGLPDNPNDPPLVTADPGHFSTSSRNTLTQEPGSTTLGSFGKGGVGGVNGKDGVNPTNGGNGNPGAILVMW